MHTYTLQREQWVERPLQRVFPFFARPENLALITPPGLDFRLLTPRPVKMEQGRVIDYTIRIFAMPVRWRTLITRYDPPWCFVDEQISGPYSFWHHTHTFSEHNGGTLLEDSVRYSLPLLLAGPARGLAHALYVRPMVERIFDYRREIFDDLFGSRKIGGNRPKPVSPAREEVVL
jgi:ligand-binding SRPBCC domain-containing protein